MYSIYFRFIVFDNNIYNTQNHVCFWYIYQIHQIKTEFFLDFFILKYLVDF